MLNRHLASLLLVFTLTSGICSGDEVKIAIVSYAELDGFGFARYKGVEHAIEIFDGNRIDSIEVIPLFMDGSIPEIEKSIVKSRPNIIISDGKEETLEKLSLVGPARDVLVFHPEKPNDSYSTRQIRYTKPSMKQVVEPAIDFFISNYDISQFIVLGGESMQAVQGSIAVLDRLIQNEINEENISITYHDGSSDFQQFVARIKNYGSGRNPCLITTIGDTDDLVSLMKEFSASGLSSSDFPILLIDPSSDVIRSIPTDDLVGHCMVTVRYPLNGFDPDYEWILEESELWRDQFSGSYVGFDDFNDAFAATLLWLEAANKTVLHSGNSLYDFSEIERNLDGLLARTLAGFRGFTEKENNIISSVYVTVFDSSGIEFPSMFMVGDFDVSNNSKDPYSQVPEHLIIAAAKRLQNVDNYEDLETAKHLLKSILAMEYNLYSRVVDLKRRKMRSEEYARSQSDYFKKYLEKDADEILTQVHISLQELWGDLQKLSQSHYSILELDSSPVSFSEAPKFDRDSARTLILEMVTFGTLIEKMKN